MDLACVQKQKSAGRMEASFCPFDMSKANSKISCVVVKEQRGCKVICKFVSRMISYPPTPIWRCFCLRGCFEHVCDSVAVDSVIYPYMLWSRVPCGLALAYCSVTLLVLYKEKKSTCRWGGRGMGSEPRNK